MGDLQKVDGLVASVKEKVVEVMEGIRALGRIPSTRGSSDEHRLALLCYAYRHKGYFTCEQLQELDNMKIESVLRDIHNFGRLPSRRSQEPQERKLMDRLVRLLGSVTLSDEHRVELASLSHGAFSAEDLLQDWRVVCRKKRRMI